MGTRLGRILAYPLHRASWDRPAGSKDYRITNGFDGPDLINGGIHRAVDVGNFRSGDPLYAPLTCRARGMRHSDGSNGVEFEITPRIILRLWHLSSVKIGYSLAGVKAGQLVGFTGNSGRQPMPAHTHIELRRDGVPFDPEPHLFGAEIGDEEDMQPTLIVTQQWRTLTGPDKGWFLDRDGNRKHFTASEEVWTVAEVTMADGTNARLVSYGPTGEPLVMPRANLVPIDGTRVVGPAHGVEWKGRMDRAAVALEGANRAVVVALTLVRDT